MITATRDASGPRSVRRRVRWLAAGAFILAVPLFLITTNVRQVTNDRAFYERGFARWDVARRTGLTPAQLRDVAQAFIDYFAGASTALDLRVELAAAERPLFNQRELAHMQDVRHLMDLVRLLQLLSGGTIALVTLVGLAFAREGLRELGRLGLLGAGATAVVLLLLGSLSLLDFSEVFLRFHMLSFSNDLWILDPGRDYLLMLFPEGFWFDATMRIAGLTAIEALAIGALGLALRARLGRR